MSPCGSLAFIVFSDGSKSIVLPTKRRALEIGESMLGIKIDEFEWRAIRRQIHDSTLIDKNTALEQACDELQNNLEELKRMIEKVLKKIDHDHGDDWKKG